MTGLGIQPAVLKLRGSSSVLVKENFRNTEEKIETRCPPYQGKRGEHIAFLPVQKLTKQKGNSFKTGEAKAQKDAK